MKKISIFVVLALLFSVGSVFAFTCEESQSAGGPDNCWTVATLSNAMTTAILNAGVSAGSVFIYDVTSGQLGQNSTLSLAQTGATLVKLSTVSADNSRVAGILQTSIDDSRVAAGSQVRLQVRGLGDILTSGNIAITSGDALIVQAGANGTVASINAGTGPSIATALETYSTATGAKKKAIIRVI